MQHPTAQSLAPFLLLRNLKITLNTYARPPEQNVFPVLVQEQTDTGFSPDTYPSYQCCRAVVAKGALSWVALDRPRLNPVINSSYQWLAWSKVLFTGSKSNRASVHSFATRRFSPTSCFGTSEELLSVFRE